MFALEKNRDAIWAPLGDIPAGFAKKALIVEANRRRCRNALCHVTKGELLCWVGACIFAGQKEVWLPCFVRSGLRWNAFSSIGFHSDIITMGQKGYSFDVAA